MAKKTKNPNHAGSALIIVIAALLCFGALMVFSAGAGLDQQIDPRQFWRYATTRRVVFTPIVLILLLLAGRINYRKWIINTKEFWLSPVLYLMLLAVILLVMVLIPGVGTEVNESRRWLKFGPARYGLTFQPSELAKWVLPMTLAAYACFRGDNIKKFWSGFVPALVLLLLTGGLIGKEDFGTAALVTAVSTLILLVGGVRWRHLAILIPIAAVAFYVLVYSNDYRWSRVMAYYHGSDASNDMASAYHAQQSIMAISSGGLFGVGLGQGTIKQGWIPEDTTDFIFAVIGEELGLVGCSLVIILFILLVAQGLFIARRAPDRIGRLLAIAVTTTIGAQAVMNLMVVTGLAPTKGIALPFVSAGGTGLVITAAAAGILVNIARQSHAESINQTESDM